MGVMADNVREASNGTKGEPMTDKTLTIRRADSSDTSALFRLAALDSASPPTGEALLAEVGGELWAAVEVDSGTAIADPFRPSGELVDLLRLQLSLDGRPERSGRGALSRLLPRAA
ncbi:MAG TPA: hypothetical protein VFY52_07700 [Thermoleophilaceae bacterium]|nr:hypothetical protein [Thermoleophilaceae bacterium]